MNKIVITSTDEFREVITALEESAKKVSDIFDTEVNNDKKIDGTDSWTSYSQQVVSEKLSQLSENYDPIRDALNLYTRFLNKTVEDYEKMEQEIDNNAEEYSKELDVNS